MKFNRDRVPPAIVGVVGFIGSSATEGRTAVAFAGLAFLGACWLLVVYLRDRRATR